MKQHSRLGKLLLLLGLALGGGTASAGTASPITNTAHVAWGPATTRLAADSNLVSLDRSDTTAAVLTAYRADASVATKTQFAPAACLRGGALVPPPGTRTGGTSTQLVSATLAPTSVVHPGEIFYFELTAPLANRDPAAVDTIQVVITTKSGDRETLTAYETGPNTGQFVGSIGTQTAPPAAVTGDCVLSLATGDQITVEADGAGSAAIATVTVDVLTDPYGLLFDSEDGSAVSGVRVTLVDAATGTPATVYAPDGKTAWPSTVVTGQPVTDGAGNTYTLPPGEYRFPLAPQGTYKLQIQPPAPYTAPSRYTAAQLGTLSRPDGGLLTLVDASYGGALVLATPEPVRIDVPLDRPTIAIAVTKSASAATASPGDGVVYTVVVHNADAAHAKRSVAVVDKLPAAMRLRPHSVRIDGIANATAATISSDGRQITIVLGGVAASATRTITYALEVRTDAPEGQAVNTARATDSQGTSAIASAAVRITKETIDARMTLIGRVVDAPCDAKPPFLRGIPNIRMMLEDGSYAITDRDGRYHFEGLTPGTHVVQVDEAFTAKAWNFVDCARSTRSAGSATSRFVEGQGGTLAVADFHAVRGPGAIAAVSELPKVASDREASGAERDWFTGGSASVAWLYPEPETNPRTPVIRVAIRHLPGQTIELAVNGKPVDPITLDGTRDDAAKAFAVTLWRGIVLDGDTTVLTAKVIGADGKTVQKLERIVHFSGAAARAQYLPDRSKLTADGVHRAVIAVRMVDRHGQPLHQGSTGPIDLPAPYETAAAIDADQARMLSGLERATPNWRVAGDDGIAYIELAPTSISGALTMGFQFRDHDQVRVQKIDLWMSPGERPWTIVGLAEGRVGRANLGSHVEPLALGGDKLDVDGRIAFYAKGRILGRWLLTASYDSAKRRDDQPLGGSIDPRTYYTVYADRSERRFDAASQRKIYIKLENRQFYALFGDFVTGFNDTVLGRYQRSGTGFKSEFHSRHVQAAAFAARFDTSHRRDEIQGNGLSGPYALSSRDIAASSEQVVIEVRDRLRSERIVERRALTRFTDYDIDYAAGTIRFSSPVLSRSSALDPQFIVVDYELYALSAGQVNAGARATWTNISGTLRVGATAIRDSGDQGKTVIGAIDARLRLGTQNEIRAEVASSGANGTGNGAWLVEAEHRASKLDILGYARQQDPLYGVAQQNLAERGRRKIGVDGNIHLSSALSLSGSAWEETDLTSDAQRFALRGKAEYKFGSTSLHLGLAHAEDRTTLVPSAVSTLVEAGATHAFDGGKLTLDATSSFAIGHAESVDFPAQQKLAARYAINPAVALTGSYEIATGTAVKARTARIGFDLKPWAGARLTSSVGDQDIAEYGKRAFAAFGLAQSLQLSKAWSVDATLDGNHTLHGINASKIVNPAQPVASGGFLGATGAITEDFTAVTLGATYRARLWSATSRFEERLGQFGDRTGITVGAIRQLGEGSVLGALGSWTHATATTGTGTGTLDLAVSGAYRPLTSRFSMLGKVSWRVDRVTDGVAGQPGPIGFVPLNVTGNALSKRVVGSASFNYAPYGRDENGLYQRSEFTLFVGTRYVFDRIAGYDLKGLTTMIGADARIGLGEAFEIGATGTLRGQLRQGNYGYAAGPEVGYRAAKNMLIQAGYNVVGFADRDFADARTTRAGPFVSLKLKFDQNTFAFLGLKR